MKYAGTLGLLLLTITLAALAPGRAEAGDPPGFPSTGSAAKPTPPTPPAPGGQPPTTADALASERIAAIKKFARDKQADPAFAEHEASGAHCRIDHDQRVVTLTFGADGVQHCTLPELAEGYKVDVWILTVKSLYATGNHYRVTVKPGDALKAASVHGSSDDVKAALKTLSGLLEDYTTAAWWHAPAMFGPYHSESITLTVALDEAGVSEAAKLTIAPLYSVNLGVAAIVGPGFSTYAVADGKISESTSKANLDYYFGVHLYPLSWHRNGNGKLRPGRYFSDSYGGFPDRISLLLGVNLAHPTQAGYLGAAIEVYSGISITGGWQPRKLDVAKGMVGDAIMGDVVPTDSHWKLGGWGVGLSVDATLLKPLLATVQ